MKLIRNALAIFILSLFFYGNTNAALIDISTPAQQMGGSFIFGDYIFELVAPNPNDGLVLSNIGEEFIVSAATNGGNFTLRRLDSGFFDLLSIRHGGEGLGTIGGIAINHSGSRSWQDFSFSGEVGVTNVNYILFSPNDYTQIAAFEVQNSQSPVPVPAAIWLFISGLTGLVGVRIKSLKSLTVSA